VSGLLCALKPKNPRKPLKPLKPKNLKTFLQPSFPLLALHLSFVAKWIEVRVFDPGILSNVNMRSGALCSAFWRQKIIHHFTNRS